MAMNRNKEMKVNQENKNMGNNNEGKQKKDN